MTDKDRLDALEAINLPPGYGWEIHPGSISDRYWRLQITSNLPSYPTVRDAIDGFVELKSAILSTETDGVGITAEGYGHWGKTERERERERGRRY